VLLAIARTETGPLAELLAVGNLDQRDLVLRAQGNDQLLVGLLLALLVQDTHVSLTAVQGLGSLTQTTGKTVVHESQLQNTLEGIENGHLALGGVGGDLDLILDLGGVVLFYVRLFHQNSSAPGNLQVPHDRDRGPRTGSQQKNISLAGAIGAPRRAAGKTVQLTILAVSGGRAILEDCF
jgi:hypothetical protein